MARNTDDLVLSARYIHTGNSGVTVSVSRDVRKPDRAVMSVRNGAFGAFSTEMVVRGHDSSGMTSAQLRDLALMFMDAAAYLDEGRLPLHPRDQTPDLLNTSTYQTGRHLPPSIEDLLPSFSFFNIRGQEIVPELLEEFPELQAFFDAWAQDCKARESESGDAQKEAASIGDREKRVPENQLELAKSLEDLKKRKVLVALGLQLLRGLWLKRLASSEVERAKKVFRLALDEAVL